MLFWDSSALVPLLIREQTSGAMRDLLRRDRRIAASFITPLEVSSAIWRRLHHASLDAAAHAAADTRFAVLSRQWAEVSELRRVLDIALDLVRRHALRAGDAIQLASAIATVEEGEEERSSLPFVTLDEDLADAARAEGFPVLP